MPKKTTKHQTNSKSGAKASRIFYYFWQTLMRHKVRTAILIITVPAYTYLSSIVVPQYISTIIGQLSGGDTVFEHYISTLIITSLVIFISNIVLVRVIDWFDWSLDARGSYYLDNLAFDKLVYASNDFHKNHFSGSIVSQASKLSSAFVRLKSTLTWDLYPLILSIIFTSLTIFFISPIFALILLAYVLIFSFISILIYSKTRHYDVAWASADNKRVGKLSDAISNALSIKSYANEDFEKHLYDRANQANVKALLGVAKISNLRNFFLNIINTTFFILFIIMLINGPALFGLSIANIVLLYSLTNTMINRIWGIGPIMRNFNRSISDAKEMVEILDTPATITNQASAKDLKVKTASIDFHDITFQHPEEDTPLFKDFSLQINAGERIGLVGSSGSGKSTLTKLLLRFSDLQSGHILIDGQDISAVTQNSLRQNIAYVPQDTILFHRSIFDNIAYGKPGATKQEVIRAAKLANAHDFITKLPDGYNTPAGERGSKLSGGQRQRIAIARAILKDAPILILDEATSALDTESEKLIQEALEKLMKGRTSLVIAHRLSTVSSLDRIVVLQDGQIAEQGTHRQLLLKDGLYQKLWSAQGGALLDSEEKSSNDDEVDD